MFLEVTSKVNNLNVYLVTILSILGIISAIITIYVVAFKGAKKNIEQDHRIANLENDFTEIKGDVKIIKKDNESIKLDIKGIKTILQIRD